MSKQRHHGGDIGVLTCNGRCGRFLYSLSKETSILEDSSMGKGIDDRGLQCRQCTKSHIVSANFVYIVATYFAFTARFGYPLMTATHTTRC